ncbi:MAG TPA: ADP-ribosylglycohydrolase family protein [Phycisphaerales bacterium]|nr:ADP-ribosylglycohydrolase family protein [Phycisphaerales bacterium]
MKSAWILAVAWAGAAAAAQDGRPPSRDEYASHLRGMWLGECIANWTGLRSEGKVKGPPFLTDDDWGRDLGDGPLEFVLDQDPWLADDDTDVEYVALHLMHQHRTRLLTGEQIAAGWLAHMDDRFLWVSNLRALEQMRRGVTPPSTGSPPANPFWLFIDAQLTTELFGAMAPGNPALALRLADLPIATTARGHAAHAAQCFALMYCLALDVDPAASRPEQVVWLVREAGAHLPDTSKAADILGFVLADYLANPDKDDWERTRDRVYERYQLNAGANGFRYRGWTESSVNFATGLIALLYGEGDYLRTVQIGTLSGWDSDNGTATMGGLLGLMRGYDELVDEIRAEHPGFAPSDRYDIERTRNNLPDYLPDDPEAQDTFTRMAERMIGVMQLAGAGAGPRVGARGAGRAAPLPGSPPAVSPSRDVYLRSANNQVRLQGGAVTAWSSVASDPPEGYGSRFRSRFGDGFELDDSGRDTLVDGPRVYYSTLGAGQQPGDTVEVRVTYDQPVLAGSVIVLEGDHFASGPWVGGWLDSARAEVLVGGVWVEPAMSTAPQLDAGSPFQVLEWRLAKPLEIWGVRVIGQVGGPAAFATFAELDVLTPSR